MHKYQPRIHLVKRPDSGSAKPITDLEKEPHKTFIFPEAIFTAVTAYQNQLVSVSLRLSPPLLFFHSLRVTRPPLDPEPVAPRFLFCPSAFFSAFPDERLSRRDEAWYQYDSSVFPWVCFPEARSVSFLNARFARPRSIPRISNVTKVILQTIKSTFIEAMTRVFKSPIFKIRINEHGFS